VLRQCFFAIHQAAAGPEVIFLASLMMPLWAPAILPTFALRIRLVPHRPLRDNPAL